MTDEITGASPAEGVPTGAPAADNSGGAAPDSGASTAPVEVSAETAGGSGQEGVEKKGSTLKPIPPTAAARARDESGKFTKDLKEEDLGFRPKAERNQALKDTKAPAPPVAAKPGEKAPQLPVDPNAPPAATKPPFKFAGRDFKDQADAENYVKSWEGQLRKKDSDYQSEAEKAQGWYQHALGLQERLKQYESGTVQPGAKSESAASAPAPKADPNDPFGGIDMGIYQELVNRDGPHIAGAWLAGEMAKTQQARVEAQIAEAIAPFKQAQERTEKINHLSGTVDQLAQWATTQTREDGTPMFEGLGNPESERAIGENIGWLMSQGVPEQFALSPDGLRIASLLWRADHPGQSTPSSAPNPVAASVAAALLQQVPSADPVSGPSAATADPGRPLTREEQVKRDMMMARAADPDLGFIRRSTPAPSMPI